MVEIGVIHGEVELARDLDDSLSRRRGLALEPRLCLLPCREGGRRRGKSLAHPRAEMIFEDGVRKNAAVVLLSDVDELMILVRHEDVG